MDAHALTDWEKSWQLTVLPGKCCVLCISSGEDSSSTVCSNLIVRGSQLPVVNSTLDFGITVTNDLSSCVHMKNIVAKAHACANAIHRWFFS